VVGGKTPGVLNVTPIFWTPPGATAIPTSYIASEEQFLTDVGASDNQPGNVFSGLQQYTNGASAHLRLQITTGPAIVTSDPYPTASADKCTHDTGAVYANGTPYTGCVTAQGILDETSHVISTHSLPVDTSHAYVLFTAQGVEGCEGTANGAHSGVCTANKASTVGYCGWHSSTYGSPTLLFLSMPWPVFNSSTNATCEVVDSGYNQFPQGTQTAAAQVEDSVLSHELSETITDPTTDGWFAVDGSEIADLCVGHGGTVTGPAGAGWNQTLNGRHYILQEEFSNATYAKNVNAGCLQAWTSPSVAVTAPATVVHGSTVHVSCSPASAASMTSSLSSCTWKVDGVTVPPTTRTTVTFVLRAAGMHTVTATVIDVAGFSGTSSTTVHAT